MSVEHDPRSNDPASALLARYNKISPIIRSALIADERGERDALALLHLLYGPLQVEFGAIRLADRDGGSHIFRLSNTMMERSSQDERRAVFRLSLQGFLRLGQDILAGRALLKIDPQGNKFEERSEQYFDFRAAAHDEFLAAAQAAQITQEQLKYVDAARARLASTRGDKIAIRECDWEIAESFQGYYLCTIREHGLGAGTGAELAEKFLSVVTAGLEVSLPSNTNRILQHACLEKLAA